MRRFLLSYLIIFSLGGAYAQVTTNPVCFSDTDEITIVYDAMSGTSGLVGASKVYIHSGVIVDSETGTSWQNVIGNWGADDGIGEMTKVSGQSDKWEITITPRTYYNVTGDTIVYRLGMVFRNTDGSQTGKNDSNADIFVNLAQDVVSLQLSSSNPLLVNTSDMVPITASTCSSATFNLYINNVLETTQSGSTQFNYSYEVIQPSGTLVDVKLVANVGAISNEKLYSFSVRQPTASEPRPVGIIDGINYGDDPTKAVLSLLAPFKSSVYVVGDFNNWSVNSAYQMKQDGEHFWIEISSLNAGQEYAYQYLVDENIWIADPYADKILDPDDKWIPDSTYPNLKTYPDGAIHSQWYHNRTAVLQTNQTPYQWLNTSFQKPKKEKLVVYELLVRDFLGEENMNYRSLIDTLGYLEELGVNAIELMPIMEFAGNDSWGYNPTFMFAVDKAYGTKNDLKEFIDAAHGKGMAVILDMVMNQNDIPSPYAQMYFDFNSFKPTPWNPWFNVDAKHPYNVFFDINHESVYTQTWLDSINHYWVNEFHFDGFRFDLSKGFTQNFNTDVNTWGQKDDSRIAILERMADVIWSNDPSTYVILEHFADNEEEKILSDYGMMLWGNAHWDYKDANLGNAGGKSLNWHYYQSRNWVNNYLISYMESHDEQRQMYEMLNHGKSSASYNIKDTPTALNRLKLSASFFFTVPGPKMIWQFGEFGYDVSIDENGRTGRKPTKWEYLDNPDRKELYDNYSELIGLRNRYDVFTEGDFTWQPYGKYKSIHISNTDTSIVVLGNFDVESTDMNPEFHHAGTWYDFFSGVEFTVDDVNATLPYGPGEYHIYTDKKLHTPDIVLGLEDKLQASSRLGAYPNPTSDFLNIYIEKNEFLLGSNTWSIINSTGKEVMQGEVQELGDALNVISLPLGVYTFLFENNTNFKPIKFIKN